MIIRLADCLSQPWKNGMGRTREIAVHPPTATSDDFVWRVSIAEVDSAAPFSRFAGIDREIVLLDGAGFTMHLADGREHALTTPLVPFAFAGELGVTVTLAGGATRDFNLMLRRDRVCGTVLPWLRPDTYRPDPMIALIYCAHGTVDTPDGSLQVGDAWQPEPGHAAAIALNDGAAALAVRVQPRTR
jgi:environmental stress-induced protein Ves